MGRLAVILGSNALGPGGEEIAAAAAEHGAAIVQRHGGGDGGYVLPHQIDHVANRWRISYHAVALNGQPFEATWAGAGKIALWGADGLGMIDTRSWTTQAVASGVTHAVATPLGLAAWGTDPVSVATLSPLLR